MQKVDFIVKNAGQLVTCASPLGPKRGQEMQDVGIITNGAVAVSNEKIVAVGETEEILRDFEAVKVVDAAGKVVCPAFVDPHTHIVFAGNRLNEFELKIKGADYLEILAAGGGIISTVRNTRSASEEQLWRESSDRLEKMHVCGTGTAEIKTGYGLDTGTELKMLQVIAELDNQWTDIVPTFLAAHAVPPEYKNNPDGYVDLICSEMLPKAWDWYQSSHFPAKGTPFFADVFCERNAFDLEQSRRVLETAKGLGFKLKAHVDQFTNLGGATFAVKAGAISIDHLDTISEEEIKQLAASDTVGVVIPTENFSAGKTQFAGARKMIDAGCVIAISTDYNPGSAPCPSQSMAMAIACRYQKLLPSEALNAVTINAAYAVGLGERTGSIEVGKHADLLVLETKDYREIAYEFGWNPVDKVIKSGTPLFNYLIR